MVVSLSMTPRCLTGINKPELAKGTRVEDTFYSPVNYCYSSPFAHCLILGDFFLISSEKLLKESNHIRSYGVRLLSVSAV